jgi:hypothetical protein
MMTTTAEILIDAFTRVQGAVHRVLDGLTDEQLAGRLDDDANSIAWLVWHLTRVQDDHLADAVGEEQVWTSEGWARRFGLPFAEGATGYGQSSSEVAAVQGLSAQLLADYHDAVFLNTCRYISGLREADFERIVDTNWNPPVSLGARLVSVISDDLQHVGQASFVRGALQRR